MKLELIKIEDYNDELKDVFENYDNCEVFILKSNELVVGYGIKKDKNDINPFEVFIKEENRGNGYGKYFFKKGLDLLKQEEYRKIYYQINRGNIIARRLIENNGGLKISQDEDITTFVIDFEKNNL